MFTVFIIGNIASGKSTAARYLEQRGAQRIDLDELAKDQYIPGSPLVQQIADEFGWDILDASGAIRLPVLAQRAFADPEATSRLNGLVHPVVSEQLSLRLLPVNCCSTVVPQFALTVVEVSAPMSFLDAFGLADHVIAVTAPRDVRRGRAIGRGMCPDDFDSRADVQPSEDELCALADTVIDNTVPDDGLFGALDAWLVDQGLDRVLGERADA
ncbi:MAG: dephospho-CoA kinase [Coriobacteriaceae bacterium]|nr:dephospho-CoA kinase [Coriobacteriaceae bacterium]